MNTQTPGFWKDKWEVATRLYSRSLKAMKEQAKELKDLQSKLGSAKKKMEKYKKGTLSMRQKVAELETDIRAVVDESEMEFEGGLMGQLRKRVWNAEDDEELLRLENEALTKDDYDIARVQPLDKLEGLLCKSQWGHFSA